MDGYDSETSKEYMKNLELDAFKWVASLITSDDFTARSQYQQDFIKNKFDKIYENYQLSSNEQQKARNVRIEDLFGGRRPESDHTDLSFGGRYRDDGS